MGIVIKSEILTKPTR